MTVQQLFRFCQGHSLNTKTAFDVKRSMITYFYGPEMAKKIGTALHPDRGASYAVLYGAGIGLSVPVPKCFLDQHDSVAHGYRRVTNLRLSACSSLAALQVLDHRKAIN